MSLFYSSSPTPRTIPASRTSSERSVQFKSMFPFRLTLSFNDPFSSRIVFSVLTLQQSSQWLDKLSQQTKQNPAVDFLPSTVLALYLRRKFFVSYSKQPPADQSPSRLTFLDWLDLLLNGTFREPMAITEWPTNFH